MARRVMLHVGCPKTGTSFVQGALWGSRKALAEQGLLVPLTYHHHYRASLFIRDVWRERPAAADIEAAWHRLVDVVRETEHDVLITHETLAAASEPQARMMIDALGGAETHIVVTARDLGRQLPAEWQQSVKQGSTQPLGDFVDDVVGHSTATQWFWKVQDVPDIIHRWAAHLPSDHVHLVTVPPRGGDRSALWGRFASVLGVDPGEVELGRGRGNESLGSVEVELLRRIHAARDDRFPVWGSQRWFKNLLANDLLARRPDKLRFAVTQEVHERLCQAAQEMVKAIDGLGCEIVGNLDDLVPPAQVDAGVDPADVGDEALLVAGIGTLLELLDVHRTRVESMERWRGLAITRGDRAAELKGRVLELEAEVAQLQRRLRLRDPRHLARVGFNLARRRGRR